MKNRLKSRPFKNQTKIGHLESGQVQITDPHCINELNDLFISLFTCPFVRFSNFTFFLLGLFAGIG